jgi:general secretion pathway protein D
LIAAAVKEVDIRPLQVLIEVVIVELTHNRSLSFGLGINLPPTPLRGHPTTTVSGTQNGLPSGDASVQILGLGGVPDLQANLTAAASRGDVNILSRPSVLAVNNEQAQINIGSQRPFVQLQRTLPTDNAAQDQVVQYEDVGTKLTIRPTISADGYVMLQVSQEVNQATAEVAFNAPVISTRSVQTQLLLKDGQTVVLGGLTDREHTVTQEGVPLLSSIPWLGGLFGQTSRTTTETELFLFITPRIIKTDDDAQTVTAPARQKAGVKADH